MQKPSSEPNPVCISHIHQTRPSFLEGLARILDIGGMLTRDDISETAARWSDMLVRHGIVDKDAFRDGRLVGPIRSKSDAEAIRSYWLAVGQYMRDSIGEAELSDGENPTSTVEAK